jgi:two-component system chemotaxis response regulator CheB
MSGRDLVVVGASAGGVQALGALISRLPESLHAAVLVVVHSSPERPSALPELLTKAGSLPARHAEDGKRIEAGRIYVAPPDRHLLVGPGCVRLGRGPREHGFRPAVDPLFRTAARYYGARVVAIILSGGLDDGTSGAATVQRRGGIVIAQDPVEATISAMPEHAIRAGFVDQVLTTDRMAPALAELVAEPVRVANEPRPDAQKADVALRGGDMHAGDVTGPPSAFTCPECGGALWERVDDGVPGFRCHVRHAYGLDAFVEKQSERVEAALWTATRTLEEQAELSRRMAVRAERGGLDAIAARFARRAVHAEEQAGLLRKVPLSGEAAEKSIRGRERRPARRARPKKGVARHTAEG